MLGYTNIYCFKKHSTSEYVIRKHPDESCNQISGTILNKILAKDLVHIIGEISTYCCVNVPSVARDVFSDIG